MLESVRAGILRPSRIILWLDPEDFKRIPHLPNILRYVARGLEVREGNKIYRSHNKYYNFVISREPGLLAVADDDVFYPKYWLRDLWQSFEYGKRVQISAHWCKEPVFINGNLVSYNDWQNTSRIQPTIGLLPLGVSGVLFPDAMKEIIASEGEAFLDKSPLADDVWLSRCALFAEIPVRQCREKFLVNLVIPFTQKQQLAQENVLNKLNDAQIGSTYSQDEVLKLATFVNTNSVSSSNPTSEKE